MRVHVALNGHLSWYTQTRERLQVAEVPGGSTVSDLIAHLGVPEVEVAFATVDEKRVDADFVLAEGNQVSLVPIIAGG